MLRANSDSQTLMSTATGVIRPVSPLAAEGESCRRARQAPFALPIMLAAGASLLMYAWVGSGPALYLAGTTAATLIPLLFLRRAEKSPATLIILCPALFFSAYTFTCALGWFNLDEYITNTWPPTLAHTSLVGAAQVVLLAATAYWLGFASRPAQALADRLFRRWHSVIEDPHVSPVMWRVYAIFALGIAARLYLIGTGQGGYFSTEAARADALPYAQIFVLLDQLPLLALVATLWLILSGQRQLRPAFTALLGIQLLTLLLAGFKTPIVFQFVCLSMAYAICRRKLPWSTLVLGLATLILLFPVNLALRAEFNRGQIVAGNLGSLTAAFDQSSTSTLGSAFSPNFVSDNLLQIIHNSGQLEPLAMIKQYVDETGNTLGGGEYLGPIFSFVPRAIWPSKPTLSDGGFVYQVVYGHSGQTSFSPTFPGNFYLNFGAMGTIAGLFFFGVLQRLFLPFAFSSPSIRYGPVLCILGIYLDYPNVDVGAWLAGLPRLLIFLIVATIWIAPREHPDLAQASQNAEV